MSENLDNLTGTRSNIKEENAERRNAIKMKIT
jgi:hypothetical protein